LFDKLDAYNLVANLVPGATLVYALHSSGLPTPSPEDLGSFILASFVVGVMTNRAGSLIIDPILRARNISFLNTKNYESFVTAERDDKKLETLVANAGLYRTFFTAGIFYLLSLPIKMAIDYFEINDQFVFIIFVIFGMVIALFSLKKEDGYIKSRLGSKKTEA
jgi:hypothetical protein